MARMEYKAVAMPQLVAGRRRPGHSSAELIAEMVSEIINARAERGWNYAGSDRYRAMERKHWWSRSEEVIYTVLLFEREAGSTAANIASKRSGTDLSAQTISRPMRADAFEIDDRRVPERMANRALDFDDDDDDEFSSLRGRHEGRREEARPELRRRSYDARAEFDDVDDDGFGDAAYDDRAPLSNSRGYGDHGYDDDDEPETDRFDPGGGRLRRPR